jgi:Cytidylyltransferase-like
MHAADDALSALFAGEAAAVCVRPDGRIHVADTLPRLVLPGSFNPLHAGHIGLAAAAASLVGKAAAFELSICNADKPPLGLAEVRRRLSQFIWLAPLWLTRAPTFREKADLFPGATFAVGADTAERVLQHRFYQNSEASLAAALEHLRLRGCRFLIAGRLNAGGRFVGRDDLGIPAGAGELFHAIPAQQFRLDVSSTEMRAAASAYFAR